MPSELNNCKIARKSLVAANEISKGEILTEDNLAIKRPGTGKSPMDYWDILGHKIQKNYCADEVIR